MPLYTPTYQYYTVPSDRGYLAESVPAQLCGSATLLPTAGRLELVKVKLLQATSVTNVHVAVTVANSGATSGQNFAALFTGAGALVGVSADQTTPWNSTGLKTMALASGPFAMAAGYCFIGFWWVGGTAPTFLRQGNNSAGAVNAGFASPNFLFSSADTGLTTTAPNPFGAQTTQAITWWAALS